MPALASSGYLKRRCNSCGKSVYLKEDRDGVWRPYASWADGQVEEGVWKLHECREAASSPQKPVITTRQQTASSCTPLMQVVGEISERFDLPDYVAVEIVGLVSQALRAEVAAREIS